MPARAPSAPRAAGGGRTARELLQRALVGVDPGAQLLVAVPPAPRADAGHERQRGWRRARRLRPAVAAWCARTGTQGGPCAATGTSRAAGCPCHRPSPVRRGGEQPAEARGGRSQARTGGYLKSGETSREGGAALRALLRGAAGVAASAACDGARARVSSSPSQPAMRENTPADGSAKACRARASGTAAAAEAGSGVPSARASRVSRVFSFSFSSLNACRGEQAGMSLLGSPTRTPARSRANAHLNSSSHRLELGVEGGVGVIGRRQAERALLRGGARSRVSVGDVRRPPADAPAAPTGGAVPPPLGGGVARHAPAARRAASDHASPAAGSGRQRPEARRREAPQGAAKHHTRASPRVRRAEQERAALA